MSTESNITAFNHIFEQRLNKLLKQIKELRKHSDRKEQIKECIKEAKKLKKKIIKDHIKQCTPDTIHSITISTTDANSIIKCSDGLRISSVEEADNKTTIRFQLKN